MNKYLFYLLIFILLGLGISEGSLNTPEGFRNYYHLRPWHWWGYYRPWMNPWNMSYYPVRAHWFPFYSRPYYPVYRPIYYAAL